MFLIHRADVEPHASTPAILNGYGGFAITETPAGRRRSRRGASEAGSTPSPGCAAATRRARRGTTPGGAGNKQNVFDDFHAAGDWLVAQG